MNKEDIKEIICENIKLTGENIKLGYENKVLKEKIEDLEVRLALDLKKKVLPAKSKSQYVVVMIS